MKVYVKPVVVLTNVKLESQLMAGSINASVGDTDISYGGTATDDMTADSKENSGWDIWAE